MKVDGGLRLEDWILSIVILRASQAQLRPIRHLDTHVHTLFRYSSDADADAESLRKDSTDSYPSSLSSKEVESIHWLEASESSIHRVYMTCLA
jgi:hypothetical protein